jgi:hypothetical protein
MQEAEFAAQIPLTWIGAVRTNTDRWKSTIKACFKVITHLSLCGLNWGDSGLGSHWLKRGV